MSMFLYICDFFGISPKEFFDEENDNPSIINEIVAECKRLDKKSLQSLLGVAKNMK